MISSGLTEGNYQGFTRQTSWESRAPKARLGAQTTHNALQSPKGVAVKDSGPLAHHALSSIDSPSSGAFSLKSPHVTSCVEGFFRLLSAVTFLSGGRENLTLFSVIQYYSAPNTSFLSPSPDFIWSLLSGLPQH